MHRIILLFSLMTLLAAVILRKLNGDRVLNALREKSLAIRSEELARKMLDSVGQEGVEVKFSKRGWEGSEDAGLKWLALPSELVGSISVSAHGKTALKTGLYLLSLRDPKAVARRRWAVRFGYVFPIFTSMVVIFALMVARLQGTFGLAIIMLSCALAAGAQLLTLTAERQAAGLAAVVLEKKKIFPRLSDEEAVISAAYAWAWRSVLPGILSRLAP